MSPSDPAAPSPRTRRILHVDVDAMFVQCAVLADPERLAHEKLIIVGGSPSGRGVVTSASYGCREYGVRSAMPTGKALKLCPRAVVVRTPGEMIRKKSRELRELLPEWSPVAVMASVDEGYLDLTGTDALYHHESLEQTARRLQASIKERTGLDVSIGGGTNRLVAKLATSFAKPAGVYVVPPGQEEEFVGRLEIGDLIGIGPAFLRVLERKGISSMASLRALELSTLEDLFGADRGRWLWRRCRGIDEGRITAHDDRARSVSSESTFGVDSNDARFLEGALMSQVMDAAGSLRRRGLYARTVTVKLRDAEFQDRSRSRTLADPVQTDRVVYKVARELLHELRRASPGKRYRLIGVALTNLTEFGEHEQQTILSVAPPLEQTRERNLSRAVDHIRAKHGDIIAPGAVSDRPSRRRRPPS